jgi:molybdopterin synthase sulfur carrier subunit
LDLKVKYFAYYRGYTGLRYEDVPAPSTIGELLRGLAVRFGGDLALKLISADGCELGPDAIVLVNGRNIAHLGFLDAPLKETDTVAIFPIVAGG